MHCIACLGKALWTTTVAETDKPRSSNRGGEKTLGLEQFPKNLFLLFLCNVHSRQYDLHEEEEEGTTGCEEGYGEGKCKFVKSLKSLVSLKVPVSVFGLFVLFPFPWLQLQAMLDALEKEREEQEAAVNENEDEPVEFYDVCNNGGKPKRRTYTTD